MSSGTEFDVVVIGGGPGGYVCAIRAAQLGLKTACVESRGTLGGTCLNVGCIPSKALLESSHHYAHLQHGIGDHGIEVDSVKLNLEKLLKRKDQVVSGLVRGIEGIFKKNKITYLKGVGSFVDSQTIQVESTDGTKEAYKARHFVIATGSAPIEIPIARFDHKFIVDSTDALNFEQVPEHLIVIGGGVIGLELGSVWSRLGAKVSVIEATGKILGATDGAVSTAMKRILEKQGLKFHLNTKLVEAKAVNGQVEAVCESEKGPVQISGDRMLVAVGRKPFTAGLAPENAQLKLDGRGCVEIDGHFRTNVPHIFAIGDVVRGAMLAHKAEEEGVAVAELIAGKSPHVNYEAIPSVVYTYPEVACIGMSEEDCKDRGIKYRKGQFPFAANGRAKALGYTEGFVKILADERTDRILGFHAIGPQVSELVAEAAIAFEYGASAEDIARSVHAHPTLAEVIKEAALGVEKRSIHI